MIIALLLLLSLGAPLLPAEQSDAEPASRVQLLPDLTLSAEDPLYLEPPPPVGWPLAPLAPLPLVRLRLFAVNAPPRIRDEPLLVLVPASAPRPSPRLAAAAFTAAKPARVEVAAIPEAPRSSWAAGLELAYFSPLTADAGLWAERQKGDWTLSGRGSGAFSGEQLGYASVELGGECLGRPWSGGWAVSGALAPRGELAAGGSLTAALTVQGGKVRAGSHTTLFAERLPPNSTPAALGVERLSLEWQGAAWGAYGSALALLGSPLEDPELRLQGLARAGLQWRGRVLRLSAGAGLLYFPDGLRLYPEALAEIHPWPVLRLTAGFSPFLTEPETFLVRAVFGADSLPALPVQGGVKARLAALLDLPQGLSAGAACEARAGELQRVRGGKLELAETQEIGASADVAWRRLSGAARRPQLTLTARAAAALMLPAPEPWLEGLRDRCLEGGMHVVFSGTAAEILVKARWGDAAAAELPALLAAPDWAAAEWAASLELRWNVRPGLTLSGGAELREPLRFRALAGVRLQR